MIFNKKGFVMKRKLVKALKQSLFLAGVFLVIFGCEKEAKEFGEQIMHPDDTIVANYDTTFKVETFVERSDSFPTLYSSIETANSLQHSNLLLGEYFTPRFGRMKARFMSQIYKSDSVSFSNVDSAGASLYFRIGENYGSTDDAEVFIYKLNKGLELSEKYYSTTNPENFYNSADLISESTEFLGDSIIKVNLTRSFADFLTTAPDTTMGNLNAFLNFFPGIYAEMDAAGNSFLSDIKIANDTSRLELAYKTAGEDGIDTLEYPISSTALRVNTYEHFYDEATAESNINQYLTNDPAENDSLLFINGPGGTRAKLLIPEKVRETFSQDTNFLARAEIELKPLVSPESPLFPESVGMYAYPADTSYVSISNSQFFNGEYDEERNVFSCNITTYLQAYINEQVNNNRLYVQTRNFRYQPAQLIVSGSGHARPVKLRIKYFKP